MKTFAAVGYLAFLGIVLLILFCRLNNKIEALVKGCNICYMT